MLELDFEARNILNLEVELEVMLRMLELDFEARSISNIRNTPPQIWGGVLRMLEVHFEPRSPLLG